MDTALIATVSALVLALITSGLTYLATKRHATRANRFAYSSRQLSELYGPLHALERASYSYYKELERMYGEGQGRQFLVSDLTGSPSGDLLNVWKYSVRHVFMPINRRIFDLIITKTDLLEDDEMPQCLVNFCAHVTGYEVTLARWDDGDFSVLVSVVQHPSEEFARYLQSTYSSLKKRHAKELQQGMSAKLV